MGYLSRCPKQWGGPHIGTDSPAPTTAGDWPAVRPAGSAPGTPALCGRWRGPASPETRIGRPAPVPAASNFCGPPGKRAARAAYPSERSRPDPKAREEGKPSANPPSAAWLAANPHARERWARGGGGGSPLPCFAETALSYRHFVFTRGLRRAWVAPHQSPARS